MCIKKGIKLKTKYKKIKSIQTDRKISNYIRIR